ncbi:MAG: tRNA pseudouridine(13) synthase TruD [Planctomycetota bacterium]
MTATDPTSGLAYLTAGLPGIGGTLKQTPEDFLVEEQPLYEPKGEGEHVYLFLEKRELTTHDLIKRVARDFRVSKREIGHAGLKDKHAVTRQHLSIHLPEANPEEEAKAVERIECHPKIKVLWAERHGNKLRRGHHGGNRFVIKARGVEPTAVVRAKPIFDVIEKRGVPNYIGEQRFGYRGNSAELGALLLRSEYEAFLDELLGTPGANDRPELAEGRARFRRGDYLGALELWPKPLPYDRQALDALRQGKPPEAVVKSIAGSQRDFLVSALQSAVFNTILDGRVKAGTWDRLLPGDVAWKHDNRAKFTVDAQTAETENAPDGRVERFEISPSAPLWGTDVVPASGDVLKTDRQALAAHGLAADLLETPHPLASVKGDRRSTRVAVADLDYSGGVDEHGPYLRCAFELPRGAYATMALREVMKPSTHADESPPC